MLIRQAFHSLLFHRSGLIPALILDFFFFFVHPLTFSRAGDPIALVGNITEVKPCLVTVATYALCSL